MKKVAFFILLFFVIIELCAQDYLISFKGNGAGTEISTVKVENLTQGTDLILQGIQILHLKSRVTDISSVNHYQTDEISFSPNPMKDFTLLVFNLTVGGKTQIEIFDFLGRKIIQTNKQLSQGRQTFRISNIPNGIYVVRVSVGNHLFSSKLLCNNSMAGIPKIVYQETNPLQISVNATKSIASEIEMQYNEGDRLKFTATFEKYRTILVDVPAQNKELIFNLVACTDADGRNYSVVQIGDKIWMAENLAYLPAVYQSSSGSLTEPRYYVYNYQGADVALAKSNSNYEHYGVLYNWQAAKVASPPGWHLPSDAEWQQLEIAMGMSQVQADSTGWRGANQGIKMKEANGWENNGNGINMIGFSALPGGCRANNDYFYYVGSRGHWWSSTDFLSAFATYRALDSGYNNCFRSNGSKDLGYSVRCVRY